jgi:hypothetical protein
MIAVYFIGGPADMTKRLIDDNAMRGRVEWAEPAPLDHSARFRPDFNGNRDYAMCQIYTYHVTRCSLQDTAIAIWDGFTPRS